jgi:hypothetical protein
MLEDAIWEECLHPLPLAIVLAHAAVQLLIVASADSLIHTRVRFRVP